VVLLDSPVPNNHQALPRQVIAHVVGKGVGDQARPVTTPTRQEALDRIEAQFIRHGRMLQEYQPPPSGGNDVPCVMVSCTRNMDTERLCGVAYPWLNDPAAREASIEGWHKLLGRPIPVLEVDCNHFEVFDAAHVGFASAPRRLWVSFAVSKILLTDWHRSQMLLKNWNSHAKSVLGVR
jgi:hypothetical protein